ncbi:hypothetical protein [Nitrosopumilus ureiphilus]|nr:hypothetical protein [Nitrosopumilus ureiphilus]
MDKLQSDRLKHFPNVNSLLKISLGLILFTIIATALVYAETISVDVEGTSYDVDYTATGMTLNSIEADVAFTSLIISVDVPASTGVLDITFERSFFDSTFDGLDEDFFVLVDQDEGTFTETETTTQSRTLSIDLPTGTEEIEIIGSSFGESILISTADPNEAADKAAADKAAADKAAADKAAADKAAADKAAADKAAADKAAADKAAADKAAADKAAADKAAADKAAADKAAADKAAADLIPKTQCGPGTILKDGACVLDERCGPGTILKDGACVLDSTPKPSETSTQGVGKQMVISVIAAFIIAGTIGLILALISKASKSND